MNKNKFLKLLKKADAFGQPIGLCSEGSPIYKTMLGGIMTLILAMFILSIGINFSMALINHENITTHSEVEYSVDPPPFIITKDTFPFAFGLRDGNYGFNNSIFTISMSYSSQTRQDGILVKKSVKLELKPCEITDFPGLENDFIRLGIYRFLCPVNLSLPIIGTFNSEEFSYYKLNVTTCINGSNPYIVCASPDVIKDYLEKNDRIRINMFYSNNVFYTQNYYNPIKRFIDEEDWIISPNKFEITCDLFLTDSTLFTDDNIFGYGSEKYISAISYNYEKDSQLYIPGDINNKQYLSVFWRRSVYNNKYYRKLNDVSNVLSAIGGFWNFLYLTIGFIAVNYNKFNFKAMLADKLFEFDIKNEGKDKLQNKMQELYKDEFSSEAPPTTMKDSKLISKIKAAKEESFKFYRRKISRSSLNIQIKDIISPFFGQKDMKKTSKYSLLNKAIKRVKYETDITYIMKKLHEVEKLKRILLNQTQLAVFNFIPPPLISHDIMSNKTYSDYYFEPTMPKNFNEYLEYYMKYMELKNSGDPISKAMINGLEKEALNIFDMIDDIINQGYQLTQVDGNLQFKRLNTSHSPDLQKTHIYSPNNFPLRNSPDNNIDIMFYSQKVKTSKDESILPAASIKKKTAITKLGYELQEEIIFNTERDEKSHSVPLESGSIIKIYDNQVYNTAKPPVSLSSNGL